MTRIDAHVHNNNGSIIYKNRLVRETRYIRAAMHDPVCACPVRFMEEGAS